MKGFSPTRDERLLRRTQRLNAGMSTGLVVKDGVRTWGHVRWGPETTLEGERGGSGVKTARPAVCVKMGLLPGVTPTGGGIDEEIEVDYRGELVTCTIVDVQTPAEAGFDPREDDGDLLALILVRNP